MNKNSTPQDLMLDYYYGSESEQFSYFRIPRLLVTSPRFSGISVEAKLLFGLLLDRMGLSQKNGWYEDDGRVYIYYSIEQIAEDFNCKRDKAMKLLAELDSDNGIGLVVKKRQGQGKPSKLYIRRFARPDYLPEAIEAERSAETDLKKSANTDLKKSANTDFKKSANIDLKKSVKTDSKKSANTDSKKSAKTDPNYNNKNYLESIYPESVNPSIQPSTENLARARAEGDGRMDGRTVRERIKKQIEHELLPYRDLSPWQLRQADELVELMVEVALTQSPSIQIGQGSYPADYVKERFAKIRCEHIEQVLAGLNENESRVTNVRAYMLASLFNSTASLESVYGLSASYG